MTTASSSAHLPVNSPASEAPAFTAERVIKIYGEHTALASVTLAIPAGRVVGLLGRNGAGKSTLLQIAAGLTLPTYGTAHTLGRRTDLLDSPELTRLGFVMQEGKFIEWMTVRQHLDFTARLYQVPDAPARYARLLDELELTAKADQLPGDLSRGMKQKVQIACGLLHSPRVIFFDEPLTGLDPLAIRRMKDTIRRLATEGAAVVLSSHLLHLVEELCSRILILKNGTKVAHGTVDQIRSQFAAEDAGADLEEVFIRIATGTGTPPPPPPSAPAPQSP